MLTLILALPAAFAQTVTMTTLHTFSGDDGSAPTGELLQLGDGSVYGTTNSGGASGNGTIFKFDQLGTFTNLYSFTRGPDGANPEGGLVQGKDGYLYGATVDGGASGAGTAFRINTAGLLSTLYTFTGGSDGSSVDRGVTLGRDGNLYGLAAFGGDGNDGTAFRLTGSGTFNLLHSFMGLDGQYPDGALVQDSDGQFYGTTYRGGESDNGVLFKLGATGSFVLLHSFAGGAEGAGPVGAPIRASDGNFYGTTTVGAPSGTGYGTIYRYEPGSGVLTTIYAFSGGEDGCHPYAALIQGTDGALYGTAGHCGIANAGTVFRITTAGVFTRLHSFAGGADGANPIAGLIIASDGDFYGSTAGNGGALGDGTIFKIRLPTGPLPPTDLVAIASKFGASIKLKWVASAEARSYNIYAGETAGNEEYAKPRKAKIRGTSTTVFGLRKGDTYCFTVSAVDALGPGFPSNEACVAVK